MVRRTIVLALHLSFLNLVTAELSQGVEDISFQLQIDDECVATGECSLYALQVRTRQGSVPDTDRVLDDANKELKSEVSDTLPTLNLPTFRDVEDTVQSHDGPVTVESARKKDISKILAKKVLANLRAVLPYYTVLTQHVTKIGLAVDTYLGAMGMTLVPRTPIHGLAKRVPPLPRNTRYVMKQMIIEQTYMLDINADIMEIKRRMTKGEGYMTSHPSGPPESSSEEERTDLLSQTNMTVPTENGTVRISEVNDENIPLGEGNSRMVKRNYKELVSRIKHGLEDVKELKLDVIKFAYKIQAWLDLRKAH